MSHVVVRTLPIHAHLAHQGAGAVKLLAHDQARAKKILAGLNPHGPKAFHQARAHRHHHRHGHLSAKPTGGNATQPAQPAQPTSSSGDAVDVTDAGVTYTASVGVGSPATDFTLLIDTGSSNTWVGAGQKYTQTSTSKKTGDTVNVSYGSGSFSGTEFTDTVTLASGLVIQNQSIGVASTATGFSDVDGILGCVTATPLNMHIC